MDDETAGEDEAPATEGAAGDGDAGDEAAEDGVPETAADQSGTDSLDLDPVEVPDGATENHWKQLVLEMEQSAEGHRKAGWSTTVLHPEASGVLQGEEPGIGVVVSREEFEALDEVVSTHDIEEYEVMRADLPGEIQTLTILYTADGEFAIFVPAALDADRLNGLRAVVSEAFYTHVTPPEDDATISFTHDDPSLFFPGAEMPRTAQTRDGLADGPGDSGGTDEASESKTEEAPEAETDEN